MRVLNLLVVAALIVVLLAEHHHPHVHVSASVDPLLGYGRMTVEIPVTARSLEWFGVNARSG